MDKLLTIRELAETLGIAPGTAYHWLSQGRLPCIRFSNRCVRFRASDLEKLVEELVIRPMKPDAEPQRSGK